ncbi:MAG: sulfite exporter TauE/SafE family protein [Notoacmeibacter sp.]|nr:sulfite exporter TauE/SafE family protein [Notoacmeibacter sp.]
MTGIVLAVIGLFLGGLLKGATGAGAPILAVPLMAIYFGVPTAVTIFAIPNMLANVWQAWAYRADRLPPKFMLFFAGGGALGTGIGTLLLAYLPGHALTLAVALAVFVYVGFRLARPAWKLAYPLAERLAPFFGTLGGVLFGATGVSAPVSLSFLNAMKLERRTFVATVTVFFVMMGIVQIPMLFAYGIMDGRSFLLSLTAILPIWAGMPVGAWLARYISREMFDRIILAVLTVIALRLLWGSLSGAG